MAHHTVMNLPELIQVVERLGNKIAHAITPLDAAPEPDAVGGVVGSLSEAVMGVTAGLVQIAQALESVASAIDRHGERQ